MRKTAKNSTFREYIEACPYWTKGYIYDYCKSERYRRDFYLYNPDGSKLFMEANICSSGCPRMKRWRKIHNND